MKKIYHLALGALAVMSVYTASAQKGNVGIGTTKPDESAALEISAVDKGFLIPRLSQDQMQSIKSPATGLMIYQTGTNSGFYFYNGNKWSPLFENDAKSVATLDINGWALDGNATATANKAAATAASFIGTPTNVPVRFEIAGVKSGQISPATSITSYGWQAGQTTTGSSNSAFGHRALAANTTGTNNTAFGHLALTINTGATNTAFGSSALASNVGGNQNVAVGGVALWKNASGSYNVAIGTSAMQEKTSGDYNMAFGFAALRDNLTGANNMALGTEALRFNLGSNNVAIGTGAGRGTAAYTSSGNTFIGFNAGYNETGSNKLYISNSNSPNPLIKGDFAANNIQVNSKTTGYLAIGDFSTATSASPGTGGLPLPANIGLANGYRLVVQDGILCEKVKVALRATGSTDWADYVFEPEHQSKMLSLEELEKFTKENKHLPNVPTTAEVQKNGLDMHETSRMFMEKIEELTLYMIELNKEVKALKSENEVLKASLKK